MDWDELGQTGGAPGGSWNELGGNWDGVGGTGGELGWSGGELGWTGSDWEALGRTGRWGGGVSPHPRLSKWRRGGKQWRRPLRLQEECARAGQGATKWPPPASRAAPKEMAASGRRQPMKSGGGRAAANGRRRRAGGLVTSRRCALMRTRNAARLPLAHAQFCAAILEAPGRAGAAATIEIESSSGPAAPTSPFSSPSRPHRRVAFLECLSVSKAASLPLPHSPLRP